MSSEESEEMSRLLGEWRRDQLEARASMPAAQPANETPGEILDI